MNFMQWLRSLDDLLYEVMAWLVFFPMTLWRSISRPLTMMNYADWELRDKEEEQFTETLSPPLFLILSLLISHGIGLSLGGGTNPILASNRGLASLISDNTTLLLLRIVLFSIFPLMLAVRFVRASHTQLTRDGLKAPFYAQCYAAAPLALIVGVGTALAHSRFAWLNGVAAVVVALAIVVYLIVQARWFSQHLETGMGRGMLNAAGGLFTALVLALGIAILFAGPTIT